MLMMDGVTEDVGPFKTNLIKHGEVAVCGENTGDDAVTEVSISNVASWAHT